MDVVPGKQKCWAGLVVHKDFIHVAKKHVRCRTATVSARESVTKKQWFSFVFTKCYSFSCQRSEICHLFRYEAYFVSYTRIFRRESGELSPWQSGKQTFQRCGECCSVAWKKKRHFPKATVTQSFLTPFHFWVHGHKSVHMTVKVVFSCIKCLPQEIIAELHKWSAQYLQLHWRCTRRCSLTNMNEIIIYFESTVPWLANFYCTFYLFTTKQWVAILSPYHLSASCKITCGICSDLSEDPHAYHVSRSVWEETKES